MTFNALLKEWEAEGPSGKRKRSYQVRPVRRQLPCCRLPDPDKGTRPVCPKPMEWQGEGVEPIRARNTRASDPALAQGPHPRASDLALQGEDSSLMEGGPDLIRRSARTATRVAGIFPQDNRKAGAIRAIDKGVGTRMVGAR